jgi:hypothetical protein
MIMMKPRKKTNTTIASQVRELGSSHSFLDILRETCARDGGRYTLSVESDGAAYTVLVDLGGPFNAIGGGSAGAQALVSASQLRSGRCTISVGWPVDQPLYQPGLDLTMKALVDGVVEAKHLPRHRGVDSLRNAEWREASAVHPAPDTTWPSDVVAGPVGSDRPEPATPSAPIAPEVAAAAPAPEVPQAVVPLPPAAAPAPEVRMAWKPVGSSSAWMPENELPVNLPAAEKPAVGKVYPHGQGPLKHYATQALLWVVECDEPEQYNFEQATTMVRAGLADGLARAVHPFRRDIDKRIHRIKDDWEKSGEVAAQATRKRKRYRPASSVEDDDPDREFRLR